MYVLPRVFVLTAGLSLELVPSLVGYGFLCFLQKDMFSALVYISSSDSSGLLDSEV